MATGNTTFPIEFPKYFPPERETAVVRKQTAVRTETSVREQTPT